MRWIIEARLEGVDGRTKSADVVGLAVIERRDLSLSSLGLTLTESRAMLAKLQSTVVSQQVAGWMAGQTNCLRCGSALAHKDSRTIMLRTVFGKVPLRSPRLWACQCRAAANALRRSVSPLCKALPSRSTPELNYLQVKWAAHLPYRQATKLLKEVWPLEIGISASDTRRKVGVIGEHLDAEVERDIAERRLAVADKPVRESANVNCVSVDSAWLHHRSSPKGRRAARTLAQHLSPWSQPLTVQRHVNIVAGRATFASQAPRVYAYVHKQVVSASARLDQFLARSGVRSNERVTVISDDAGEFVKAVEGSQLARDRILDWFHIAMKFKAAENSVFGSKIIDPIEQAGVQADIRSAKWLIWHGKSAKAVARIKALDDALLARPGYESSTLWWNLHRVSCYVKNNADTLVNYGTRHRKGLPISSSIAESAVNLVVSHRMAKKQQMRWTDEGAHRLVQVRVSELNGELSPARIAALAKRWRSTSRNPQTNAK